MELKHYKVIHFTRNARLLIVPYGIETTAKYRPKNLPSLTFNCTLWNWNDFPRSGLIVRFAFNCTLWNWNNKGAAQSSRQYGLLIVPYGIETSVLILYIIAKSTFNCTLWNWNLYNVMLPKNCLPLLIVPYGIETSK